MKHFVLEAFRHEVQLLVHQLLHAGFTKRGDGVLYCAAVCGGMLKTLLGGFTEELIQKENASIASRTHQNSYFLEKTLI